jgi:uncharacterized protein
VGIAQYRGLWLAIGVVTLQSGSMAAAAATVPTAASATGATAPAKTPEWRVTVRQFASDHFKQPAWGYSHCLRDYALARELAAEDHVVLDDDVLFAASFLHDIAAFAPWAQEKLDHSDVGADAVVSILKDSGFPAPKIAAVQGAIRTHMYYRDPVGPEALYLHDADALDWLGAIGVARIVALADPNGGAPTGPSVIAMLDENLAKVPSRVLSPAGRARVPQRKVELEEFLHNLRRETDNLTTL